MRGWRQRVSEHKSVDDILFGEHKTFYLTMFSMERDAFDICIYAVFVASVTKTTSFTTLSINFYDDLPESNRAGKIE